MPRRKKYWQLPDLVVASYLNSHSRSISSLNEIPCDVVKLCISFYERIDLWDRKLCPSDFEIVGVRNNILQRKRNQIHSSFHHAFGSVEIGAGDKMMWKFKIQSHNASKANPCYIGIINADPEIIEKLHNKNDGMFMDQIYKGYGLCSNGNKVHVVGRDYCDDYDEIDDCIIGMELNCEDRRCHLRFYINGQDQGAAYTYIPMEKEIFDDNGSLSLETIKFRLVVLLQGEQSIQLF